MLYSALCANHFGAEARVVRGIPICHMQFVIVIALVSPPLANSIGMQFIKKVNQGDIIVASKHSFRDGECIIKRVIATEGQKVRIDFESGTVYVDEEAIDEPYLHSFTLNQESEDSEWIVPEGCLFVMGDNRMESLDSRSNSIGFIDKREVLGRAVFLMLPGYDEENDIRDFSRIGVIG